MPNDWNEKETRKKFIDKLLTQSDWSPIVGHSDGKKYSRGAVEEYPTTSGPSDYILFSGGRPLAAVEGKKVAVGPQNVIQQAERYSRTLEESPFLFDDGYRIPFAYSTNGKVIWFRDLSQPVPRDRPGSHAGCP